MAKKKDSGVKRIGRWAAIGMTPVTAAWKNVNAADEHLIFLLDTASGDVHVCGDVSGVRAGLGGTSGAPLVTSAQPRARKAARKSSDEA
jgi:hypothetical protein